MSENSKIALRQIKRLISKHRYTLPSCLWSLVQIKNCLFELNFRWALLEMAQCLPFEFKIVLLDRCPIHYAFVEVKYQKERELVESLSSLLSHRIHLQSSEIVNSRWNRRFRPPKEWMHEFLQSAFKEKSSEEIELQTIFKKKEKSYAKHRLCSSFE